MPTMWADMTMDEKLDRLREILDNFVNHYNANVGNSNSAMNNISDRLKQIEKAIGQK